MLNRMLKRTVQKVFFGMLLIGIALLGTAVFIKSGTMFFLGLVSLFIGGVARPMDWMPCKSCGSRFTDTFFCYGNTPSKVIHNGDLASVITARGTWVTECRVCAHEHAEPGNYIAIM